MLWRGLTGYTVSAPIALKHLCNYFNTGNNNNATATGNNNNYAIPYRQSTADHNKPIVCLVDELDYLITRSFDVIYNFYR